MTVIPAEYSWNLLAAVLICFHCFMVGGSMGSARRKVFTKAFFEKNFPEFKDNYPQGGYPDMGSGKFAQKLPMDQWIQFNNAQRTHYNYIEGLTAAVVMELVAGLYFPRYAALLSISYLFGRILYTIMYKTAGARGRVVGVLFIDLSLVAWLGLACWGCFHAGGGVAGLKALFAF
eukprot:Phypoly_transcript_19957.p1 GENE.Phypoly_transcript_19957~~Phypoly_transcript_19957.p1  ORF type:complete len:199 (+),score=21.86 Phypoly_transcript_19957:73-597(+)